MRVLALVMSNGATSLVSLMLTIVVARQDGPSQLGIFGISYAVLSLTHFFATEVGVNRALSSPDDLGQWQAAYSRALLVALIVSIPTLVIGIALNNYIVACTAVAIPGYVAFNFLRLLTMTEGRMKRGFVADFTMLVVSGVLSLLVVMSNTSTFILMGGWALVLPLSSAILQSSLGVTFKIGWGTGKYYSGVSFGVQSIFGSGAVHLSTFVLATLFDTLLVGAIRAASTLFGPVNLITTSMNSLVIRQLASAGEAQRQGVMLRWFLLSAGVGAGGAALTWVLIYSFGALILGQSWEVAAPLIPWVALDAALVAAGTAPRAAHRVDMRGTAAWRVSIFMGASRLVLLPIGGWWAGAVGVVFFLVLSTLLSSVLWWISYITYRRSSST